MVFNAFGPENYIFKQAFAQGDEHAAAVMRNCERENLNDTGFGAQIWDRVKEGLIVLRGFESLPVRITPA